MSVKNAQSDSNQITKEDRALKLYVESMNTSQVTLVNHASLVMRSTFPEPVASKSNVTQIQFWVLMDIVSVVLVRLILTVLEAAVYLWNAELISVEADKYS